MNRLKRRKKSFLRVKSQNNFGTGNFDIFSAILPMGMFKTFLSTKLILDEVSELLKRDSYKTFPFEILSLKVTSIDALL